MAGVAAVGYVAGATILASLAISLVRFSIGDNRAALRLLRDQLVRVEAVERAEQAQLHEIRATIAGIQNASQVINGYRSLAQTRRARIQGMIDAEIGRLVRLTSHCVDRTLVDVDIDQTVEPLVVRLVAQGHRIEWYPTGAVAHGRPDDVAEIVNVLLDNAVRHGGGARIRLEAHTAGDVVEVVVSDSGPGVPAYLRERIFAWGQSGPGSTGEGIGLNVARTLSTELGGSLELGDRESCGATFVLRLPVGPQASES
jgi:signal transduction histidine kinase